MKLYDSIGPNPRVVKMFMAEKGMTLPVETVDLRGGANRREPYLSVNPAGQTPALEMDDGACVAEITAICEYLEEKQPSPPLIGTTPEERARTRMWARRADLKVCEPMVNGFRFAEGLRLFENRMRCLPEAAEGLKAVARDGIAWIDGQMAGPYLAGERFTLADILLYSFLDFGGQTGQPFDRSLKNVSVWYDRVAERPSVGSST